MIGTIQIRPVGEDEREAWNPLWAGYLTFYKTALTEDISDLAWTRFHDPDEPMFALGGYVDGRLAGRAGACAARGGVREARGGGCEPGVLADAIGQYAGASALRPGR